MSGKQLEQWEINKYWEIFNGLSPVNNLLTGDQVASVLKNSKLSDSQLEKVWDLSDIDADGNLDFEEFCIAMRLIFDMINGSTQDIPNNLPDWLIPASKAHLIQANQAISSGGESFRNDKQDYQNESDDDHDNSSSGGLSSDFDWYISPSDRDAYNVIYTANSDRHGRISFEALSELYTTLSNVPFSEITNAWNLVNPHLEPRIEKEQCLIFLHILNNRERGIRIPRSVPASLRATFEKAKPEYNLDSKQGDVHSTISDRNASISSSSKKSAFADGYLSRLGLSGRSSSYESKGTDFSSTKDTDWEEARLKRQLADLENLILKSEKEAANTKKYGSSYATSRSALIKRELEQLLEFKERQLDSLRNDNGNDNSKVRELSEANDDIEMIQQQIDALEEHYANKKRELDSLLRQIEQLKST
ncbi:hypothetical protein NADFUDRAFT_51356 [Nadsonia fulvescens var. elongata DSM 6958]|uniref:Actin cytoskeleton-regulatory complex protein END3 n=1 Tax=Nadsonia fulvescens var. elongata DSM 6958 TaxID=857566 RepID=A0A1E3PMN6_9ASCO|nr:hypothetical protein NADFUDRAFT_51356 [Nadsonia fulvescens var. elongata DSM 6958]